MDDPRRERQGRWTLQDLDVSGLERAQRLIQVRYAPAHVVDGVPDARRRVALGHEHPDIAVLETVHASLQPGRLAAEALFVPGEGNGRVGREQVHVVKSEVL